MTKAQNPPIMLIDAANDPASWEVKAVVEKFSKHDASIGEENTDYVALGYMSAQGAAYWLPRFLTYLMADAPEDSFHFDSMLTKLSNNSWSLAVMADMPDTDVARVQAFLTWLADSIIMREAPALRQAEYDHATEIWKMKMLQS
jgi:hypothetical protein